MDTVQKRQWPRDREILSLCSTLSTLALSERHVEDDFGLALVSQMCCQVFRSRTLLDCVFRQLPAAST
jgi:hypothetical protein